MTAALPRNPNARHAVEVVARESYGRLIALLSARSHDIAAAEDALADAFCAAMETWPRVGVPAKPEAWLLVVARRRLIDWARHANLHAAVAPALLDAVNEAVEIAADSIAFPDERLKLLFVCAHPAIAAAVRTPLMLQTVLGLPAVRIASAFLVQPCAMGQRLARAKAKIRDAGIRFEVPEERELPTRLDAVLEAIYAAYGSGWGDRAGSDQRQKSLAIEAIELGRLLRQLMPREPEIHGLLALMLHCEARREARRNEAGAYIPLSEQDVARWDNLLIEEAESNLAEAEKARRIGRFQLLAAIQSLHARRLLTGTTDWQAIACLYDSLVRLAPTIGTLVSRAAAVAEARDARSGWTLLETIPAESVKDYQPYWALAADLLRRMGRGNEAASAYSRAIGLCEDPAVRKFLAQKASSR
ncbi:MAG: DUF6596 domain-containing protein [Pseudomonadota bacterium]